jgi:hypothetical protein
VYCLKFNRKTFQLGYIKTSYNLRPAYDRSRQGYYPKKYKCIKYFKDCGKPVDHSYSYWGVNDNSYYYIKLDEPTYNKIKQYLNFKRLFKLTKNFKIS